MLPAGLSLLATACGEHLARGARSRGTCRSWRRPATAARRPRRGGQRPRLRTASSMSWARCSGTPQSADGRSIVRRIAADQHHGARMPGKGGASGEKSCPLPSPPAISTTLAAHGPSQRRHRGADVGALGVVVPDDAVELGDTLDAVRQAVEFAQHRQAAAQRQADGVAQRQRGERVGGVVQAAHRQFVDARSGARPPCTSQPSTRPKSSLPAARPARKSVCADRRAPSP